MSRENEPLNSHVADLEQRLREAEQQASYYQKLAEQAGVTRLKATETLSQLLVERSRIEVELQQHYLLSCFTYHPNWSHTTPKNYIKNLTAF